MPTFRTFRRNPYRDPSRPPEATDDWNWVIFRPVSCSSAAEAARMVADHCRLDLANLFVLEKPGGFFRSMRDSFSGDVDEAVLAWLRSGGKAEYDRTGVLPSIEEMARFEDPVDRHLASLE